MANFNPEDWRRAWQKTENDQHKADQERHETAENSRVEKIVAAINGAIEQLRRQTDETTPKNKSERFWKRAEVLGLWAAAAVGVTAIWVANHDAGSQLTTMENQAIAMQGQLNEMKASGERSDKLIAANEKLANATENAGRAWIAITKFSFVNLNDAKDPLKTSVFYQNVGREPARAVRNRQIRGYLRNTIVPFSKWNFLPIWHQPDFEPKKICADVDQSESTSVIYPSSTFGFSITIDNPDNIPEDVIPIATDEVKKRTTMHFVMGCFSYETLKQTKHSSFCAFLNPNNGAIDTWVYSACPVGNDDY